MMRIGVTKSGATKSGATKTIARNLDLVGVGHYLIFCERRKTSHDTYS